MHKQINHCHRLPIHTNMQAVNQMTTGGDYIPQIIYNQMKVKQHIPFH